MKRILCVVDYIEEGIIFVGLLAMTTLNFVNVLSRYFFHQSLSYTEEVIIIIFLWVTMLGIAAGYKRCAHLGMSFITDRLSYRGKCAAIVLSALLSLVLIGFMIYYGAEMVRNQKILNSRTTALRLPTYLQGLAVPVGGIFMAIRTLQGSAGKLMNLRTGREEQ